MSQTRKFSTGATRDADTDKIDLEGFLSPLVIDRFGEYMHEKRRLPDGSYRDSDNWQLGIPRKDYIKSGFRHFKDWWRAHRGYETKSGDDIETELCALIFNASGYLHELLKEKVYAVQRHAKLMELRRDAEAAQARPSSQPHWDPRWGYPSAEACARKNINPVDALTSYVASHPMASETLREQDFARDDQSTGV